MNFIITVTNEGTVQLWAPVFAGDPRQIDDLVLQLRRAAEQGRTKERVIRPRLGPRE